MKKCNYVPIYHFVKSEMTNPTLHPVSLGRYMCCGMGWEIQHQLLLTRVAFY